MPTCLPPAQHRVLLPSITRLLSSCPPPPPPPAGGINDKQYMQLRSEAKAPFRLTRIIFLGGLAVGAGLGLLIITGRLVAALQGEGHPVGWCCCGICGSLTC